MRFTLDILEGVTPDAAGVVDVGCAGDVGDTVPSVGEELSGSVVPVLGGVGPASDAALLSFVPPWALSLALLIEART